MNLQELKEFSPTGVGVRFCRLRVAVSEGGLVLFHHWHEQYEVMYVVHGHAIFHIDGEMVEARSGDTLFIPPNCLHGGYNASNDEFEYVAMVVRPDFLLPPGSDPEYVRFLSPFLSNQLRLPYVQKASTDNAVLLRRLILEAVQEFENGLPLRDPLFRCYLQILLGTTARSHLPRQLETRRSSSLPTHHIESLKRLIQYIENNYAEQISVEYAARMVNLSTFHFCKIFKRMTGRTLVDFVNLYRVNQATALLRETTLTIADIAEKVGCCNANYFSKMYFRYKGISPSTARKA